MRHCGNEALRYKWLRHVAREWCMAKVIEMHGFRLSAQAGLTPPGGFKSELSLVKLLLEKNPGVSALKQARSLARTRVGKVVSDMVMRGLCVFGLRLPVSSCVEIKPPG